MSRKILIFAFSFFVFLPCFGQTKSYRVKSIEGKVTVRNQEGKWLPVEPDSLLLDESYINVGIGSFLSVETDSSSIVVIPEMKKGFVRDFVSVKKTAATSSRKIQRSSVASEISETNSAVSSAASRGDPYEYDVLDDWVDIP